MLTAATMSWLRYVLVTAIVLCASLVEIHATTCAAPQGTDGPRSPGNDGFGIRFMGDPEGYVPGRSYTVILQEENRSTCSSIFPEYCKKFMGFLLLVRSRESNGVENYRSAGTFRLLRDGLTTFSRDCPNAISHTSFASKPYVKVQWMAPRSSSNCVTFRAAVVKSKDTWYMDNGDLTKELCPIPKHSMSLGCVCKAVLVMVVAMAAVVVIL